MRFLLILLQTPSIPPSSRQTYFTEEDVVNPRFCIGAGLNGSKHTSNDAILTRRHALSKASTSSMESMSRLTIGPRCMPRPMC